MKNIILNNWHVMRWIRLAIAVFMLAQAIQFREVLFGVIAAFFLFQSVFNTGCTINGCAIPNSKK